MIKDSVLKKSIQLKDNVITIDGPAGSGKSTIAKLLAKKLGFTYIDTGATYRTLTLLALENDIELEDSSSILEIAKKSLIELDSDPGDIKQFTKVKLNGRDITEAIRSEKVGSAVSVVSKLTDIRKYLVKLQRKIAGNRPSVLEGRDTGSVVFPNAILKIYLTADLHERITRREKQQNEKGMSADKKEIKKEIEKRDHIDSSRKDSPLIIPEDAIVIDSSALTIDEVFTKIKNLYYERIQSEN